MRRDRQILSAPARASGLLLATLLLGCGGGAGGGSSSGTERPNLVLISVDCLRADHLGCYGYGRETSPVVDGLAAAGVRFERAYSSTSWTLPAHLTMLTGLPVSGHGVDDDRLWSRREEGGEPIPPPLRGVFVSEALSRAGYATAGFYTWKYLEPQFGFGPGFDVYERWGHTFYSHPVVGPEFERLRESGDVEGMKQLVAGNPDLFDDTRASSPETIGRAIEWVEGRVAAADGRPFFLFVHLFDAHDPYTPPPPFDRMFDPDYSGPIDGRRVTAPDSLVRRDMAARDLERLVSLYDGAIRFVDSEIGRLLDRLDGLGLATNTLVVLTGDHGEEFFEHGHKTHRNQLYLESVSVPLILRWPAGLPAGRVVEGNAGLIDIAPTLCAAAGIDSPPTLGTDLLPIARGTVANGERPYLSELVRFDPGEAVPRRSVALSRGDVRTILSARGASAWSGWSYDLEDDPHELHGDPFDEGRTSAELAALRARLEQIRAVLPARSGTEPLSEADLAELAGMGYAGGGEATGSERAEERLPLDGGVWPDD